MWTNQAQTICMDTNYGPKHYQTGQSQSFRGFGLSSVCILGWNQDQDLRHFNQKSLIIWIMKSILFILWTLFLYFLFTDMFFQFINFSWAKKNHRQHWAFEFLDSPVCSSIIQPNIIVEFSQHIMYMQVIILWLGNKQTHQSRSPINLLGLLNLMSRDKKERMQPVKDEQYRKCKLRPGS